MYLVRQDRIECDPERYAVEIEAGQVLKVVNFNSFGLAVESASALGGEYAEAVFSLDGYPISQVHLKKVREEQGEGKLVTGFSVVGDPIDVDAALSLKDLQGVLDRTRAQFALDQKISPEFRLLVHEIRAILTSLQEEVNSLAKSPFLSDVSAVQHYEDRIATRVSAHFSQELTPVYDRMRKAVQGVPPESLGDYFEFFRKNVGEIMYQSAYAHRAYTKPKGYAGDYEMMNHVYQRDLRGQTLFGKCLQRYFVDEPAGCAVRNREQYLRGRIKEVVAKAGGKQVKVLSVASGPAMEIQNLIRDPEFSLENVEFCLLDQDIDALKHSQRKIEEALRAQKKSGTFRFYNLGIKQVLQSGFPESGFDVIYSAGLFDYFTDPVAMFAASRLHSLLGSGGLLIIGNFSINNPNQFAMGLIMDWNLIYRSEEKMGELFGKVGTDYWLEQEEKGINLFANIRK